MDKIIEALNEVVLSNQVQIKLMREELKELKTLASAAKKQADSSWELVLITRYRKSLHTSKNLYGKNGLE